jgi:methylated-DNA-[protein]-cysteine S-methyltransferase
MGDAMTGQRRALNAANDPGQERRNLRMVHANLHPSVRTETGGVFYDVLRPSPLGTVYLAAGPRGLVAVGLATDERNFVRGVARGVGKAPVRSADELREARRQVQGYLSGKRESFDLALDLRGATPFQRSVLLAARRIPRGRVLTYGELATRLHRPHAGRAVGQALAHNPLPVLIPCHRVVSQGGELRGYLGDRIGLKARLLTLEGVPVQGDHCQIRGPMGGDR